MPTWSNGEQITIGGFDSGEQITIAGFASGEQITIGGFSNGEQITIAQAARMRHGKHLEPAWNGDDVFYPGFVDPDTEPN